jgi:hypothetical protein
VVPLAIGAVVLTFLFFGRLGVCGASGHLGRYYGLRCAESIRQFGEPDDDDPACLLIRERSVWKRVELLLNLPQASVVIHGRRLHWPWLLAGAAVATVPLWLGRIDPRWWPQIQKMMLEAGLAGDPAEAQRLLHVLGGAVAALGLLLSARRGLALQCAGGATVRVYRGRNIDRILRLLEPEAGTVWLKVTRLGLLGVRRYYFNGARTAIVGHRYRFRGWLTVLGVGALLIGLRVQSHQVALAGVLLVAIAVALSIPRERFYCVGGFEHAFLARDVDRDAHILA